MMILIDSLAKDNLMEVHKRISENYPPRAERSPEIKNIVRGYFITVLYSTLFYLAFKTVYPLFYRIFNEIFQRKAVECPPSNRRIYGRKNGEVTKQKKKKEKRKATISNIIS